MSALRECRLDHPFVQPLARVGQRGGLSAPPGGERRRLERFAKQPLADGRQETEQGRGFQHAQAERIRHEHVSRAPRLHEPGNAERGVGAQLHRVAVVVVETTEYRVHGTKPGHGLEEHAIVPDGEIAALDERKSELTREVGVLEVGFAVRTRRQQHDVGHAATRRRRRQQRLPEQVEERRERLNARANGTHRETAATRWRGSRARTRARRAPARACRRRATVRRARAPGRTPPRAGRCRSAG